MTKIDGLEIVMTKHIKSEIDKELKKRFEELKPDIAKRYEELLNMRNMETDQFNDGFNDARAGKLETDHPHYDLDTDNWRLGYAWGMFEPMKEEIKKLSTERDELYLTISSCENALEVIQIMLEQSQEENGKLRNVLRQISEMSGFDIGDQTKYFQRIATAALSYPEPSPSDVSVTPDVLIDIKTGRSIEKETCSWIQEDDPDICYWKTGCGNSFYFTEGTPTDNNMKYCCYCGKLLKQEE